MARKPGQVEESSANRQACAEGFEAFRRRRQAEILGAYRDKLRIVSQKQEVQSQCWQNTPCRCEGERKELERAQREAEKEMMRYQNLSSDTPKARAIYQRDCGGGGGPRRGRG